MGDLEGKKGTRSAPTASGLSWSADDDLTYEQWTRVGLRLGVIGRGCGWWIGDWIRFGARRYGGRYKLATRLTGYDQQTLTNMAWVASRFPISRRREKLSWSHHAELAAFEPEAQDHWLDRAERERLTIRQLRNAIEAEDARANGLDGGEPDAGREPGEPAGPGAEGDGAVAVCPQCGHRLEPGPQPREEKRSPKRPRRKRQTRRPSAVGA